jgi:hypothetical protein
MPRVRRFDHLREVTWSLVEEEGSDQVAATAGVEPFEADFLGGGGGEGGVGAGDVVLFGLISWGGLFLFCIVFNGSEW